MSGGGGAAAALLQEKDPDATAASALDAANTVDGGAGLAALGAVPAELDASASVPEAIQLEVTSKPPGALVTDENGLVLGTTPFPWTTAPREAEVSWRFAAEGYESMTYRFSPTNDELVQVALVASPEKVGKGKDKKKKTHRNSKRIGDDVMMPNL